MNEPALTWICPPLDGPATGGTLYNAALLRALAALGVRASAVELDAGRRALRRGIASSYWVDSLYLAHLPELERDDVTGGGLGLVTHYLPSLVALERVPLRKELSSTEEAALRAARRFLATSPFLRDVLLSLGIPGSRVVTVCPGVEEGERGASPLGADTGAATTSRSGLRALMVANLLPGKGIAPFLTALDPLLTPSVSLELSVVGSEALDAECARECLAVVAASPRLQRAVRFEGPVSHDTVLRRMRASDVLVSASRMESFGMALAEARAVGLPLLARAGGNVATHVDEAAGGALCDDDAGLARALVALAGDPAEVRRRAARAAGSRVRRSWGEAAGEFVGGEGLGLGEGAAGAGTGTGERQGR